MPKTRGELDRGQKVAQILEATERRLRDGGYSAVSVAGVARELGLAHNAIYWYFPSKDELVIATCEHIIEKLLRAKPKQSRDVLEKILWFVDQLAELYPLRASLHAESQRSRPLAEYLDALSRRLRVMARNVLAEYVPEGELDIAAASLVAMVQGSFLEGLAPAERRELLTFALNRLIMQGGGRRE